MTKEQALQGVANYISELAVGLGVDNALTLADWEANGIILDFVRENGGVIDALPQRYIIKIDRQLDNDPRFSTREELIDFWRGQAGHLYELLGLIAGFRERAGFLIKNSSSDEERVQIIQGIKVEAEQKLARFNRSET